ncbi:hypothetical protein [Pseudomonas putida]|uniref:Integral membrane protein n=1 Tax=Pseudomonas putida TaxID=303 RepID=A0A1L7NQ06_PSEPU|nr:hypothetical protein [Pseudomonas putida]BAW27558.1 Integral membrane protein [Pseudomonas putida]
MHTLPLLVVIGTLIYLYRYYNPLNHANPHLYKFHKRVRVCLGVLVVCTAMALAYRVPVDFVGFVRGVQANQVQQALKRQEARQASEIKHIRQMIDVLGGPDNYLAHQKAAQSR